MRKTWEERLDRAIASHFTDNLMSDAKWRKAFRILSDPALGLTMFTCKVVAREGEADTDVCPDVPPLPDELLAYYRLDRLPGPGQLRERCTADCLRGGPLYYRVIEWIEIPARYVVPASPKLGKERQVVHQDIAAAGRALSAAGQFPIELTDERLRLYGYR